MAYFPDNIYQHRDLQNKEGVQYDPSKSKILFAEDLKNIIDEIKKIEEVLGLQINKGYDTVKEKIERCHIIQNSLCRVDWLNLTSDWTQLVSFRNFFNDVNVLFDNYSDVEFHIFTINGFYASNTKIYTRLTVRSCIDGVWDTRRFDLQNSPITTWCGEERLCYWGMKKKSEICPCGLDRFNIDQKCTQGDGRYKALMVVKKVIY